MTQFLPRRRTSLALTVLLAAAMPLFGGCKGSEMSKQEVQQIKQGPPPEMPPEARAAMQRAMQSPPPQAGQPGP